MEFRPCIDIHNGYVKQIVGSSLNDENDRAEENFVSLKDAAFYADLYRRYGIRGGHIILLNPPSSEYYGATKAQALSALSAYPLGLQVGGGIHPRNAEEFLKAGASHVIVTSYVFRDGRIDYARLKEMESAVGSRHLVLDLSCRRVGEDYLIVTDRWQKQTKEAVTQELLDRLSESCDEFLVHAVDVEGRSEGIEKPLAALLGKWHRKPVTYAGGIHTYEDLLQIKACGEGHINVTIGSALDLFGGPLSFRKVLEYVKQ